MKVGFWGALFGLVAALSSRTLYAQDACTPCDIKKVGEADNCLDALLGNPKACFTADTPCDLSSVKVEAGDVQGNPFDVTCSTATSATVKRATPEKLDPFRGKPLTLSIGTQKFTTTLVPKAKSESPASTAAAAAAAEAATPAAPTPAALPVDLEPVPLPRDRRQVTAGLYARTDATARYLFVHENFSLDPASDKFVTETDRVVVRFIARKAVLCRYYAVSDDKNEYKPEIGRVGGREGLSSVLKDWAFVGAGAGDTVSCGELLAPLNESEAGRFKIQATTGQEYDFVDFTFGPFTSDQLTFHLFRHDRQFKGNDLQADVKVANHLRYSGWVDIVVVGVALTERNEAVSVHRQNGTELTRLDVQDKRQHLDIVAQVKFFLACNGEGNKAFERQDLNSAGVCFGLGSGFSLTDPTERFYPLGINLTVAQYLSFNTMFVLERGKKVAPGYAAGDLFTGSASDVPITERIIPGIAFGIGIDPTIVGELVGRIIKAGF